MHPFFNKGKERSIIVSDFIVQHPIGPFFRLNSEEWSNAVKKYPELLDDTDVDYEQYSAIASVHIGVDGYFDNQTIFSQFERLFKLIEFKRDLQNHLIEVIVDNARTHTMREYSLNDFGMNPGTRCPAKAIKYFDQNNKQKILNCYFTSGPLKGKSKGLLNIAYDLGLSVPVNCKLEELKSILINHAAFKKCKQNNPAVHISVF